MNLETILKQTINDWVNERIYKDNKNRTLEDLTEELEGLLINNLRRMSPEKRKFCSILSGGVDSTLVVKKKSNTFTPNALEKLFDQNTNYKFSKIVPKRTRK